MDTLSAPSCSVIGWDEIELEKVTELISRKLVAGDRQMLVQAYLKRGALVPLHTHESEQMTYVLDGMLKIRVDGEEVIVRDGEVVRIPSGVPHQTEALADTFELDVFSPVRKEWLGDRFEKPDVGRQKARGG
jgi:quercetin dioxygenase-like cupin family protein